MSSDPPISLSTVMVVQDRYGGGYGRGRWWAVARGDDLFEGMTRIAWLLEHGPGSDDVTCSIFWGNPPPWIAVGDDPDAAISKLCRQEGAGTDDWAPPRWEDDPRSARWLRFVASQDKQENV